MTAKWFWWFESPGQKYRVSELERTYSAVKSISFIFMEEKTEGQRGLIICPELLGTSSTAPCLLAVISILFSFICET